MKIEDVLASRTDLSTFLVHLTRASGDLSAKDVLLKIIRDKKLLAGAPLGIATKSLSAAQIDSTNQRVVCFTETPMAHLSLLTKEIEGRMQKFEPFGIAVTRKQARRKGANPVWYVDITPGHDWLTNPLNELVRKAIDSGSFDASEIAKLAPFVEQMGAGPANPQTGVAAYRKEFWREREWRYLGDFYLPNTYIVLCPAENFREINQAIKDLDEESILTVKMIDPSWSLENIIGKMAGFSSEDLGPF